MFSMSFRTRSCPIRERKLEVARRRNRRPIDSVLEEMAEQDALRDIEAELGSEAVQHLQDSWMHS